MSRDTRSLAETKATKARFTGPPALSGRATASPADGFSRNTKHETRIMAFTAARSLLSCALWCGMGRLWRGMGGCRPPLRQQGLLGFHQPRDTQHGFSLFLSLRRLQGEQPQPRPTGFHDTRDTNHELCRRPVAAFLRVVARHGAAWAAAVSRSVNTACWVFTSHETRKMVFPCPSDDSKESNPNPGQRVFTNHETRITNHGFYDDE